MLNEVDIRIRGEADLAKAEARYHKLCYDRFCKFPQASCTRRCVKPSNVDAALASCIDYMYEKRTVSHTTGELYDNYCSAGGQLTKKKMLANLCDYFGEKIVVLHIEGCASIVGFRDVVGKTVKMVKYDGVDDESVEIVVRRVKAEVLALPRSNDYDLSYFTFEKTIYPTLLALVSQLVSNGELNKSAVTTSQCIQQHISNSTNQTTLGLAVKLHHKFGSSELVKVLNEHGIVTTYDEVMRFRKSAAKHTNVNEGKVHEAIGLMRRVGAIFGWFDNFDLLVCTPNDRRETHAMAIEFQKHPLGVLECGIHNLTIPRPCMREVAYLRLGRKSL